MYRRHFTSSWTSKGMRTLMFRVNCHRQADSGTAFHRGAGHPPIVCFVCEHGMTTIAVVYTPTPKTIDW